VDVGSKIPKGLLMWWGLLIYRVACWWWCRGGGVVTAYPPTAPVCPQRPSPDDQEAPGPQGGQAGGVLRGPTRRLPERRLARARAGPTGGSPPRNWPNAHLIGFCFPREARLFGHPHPHMSKTQDLVFETHDARSGISPLFGRCA